jgi:hypothetical protein
MFYKCTDVKYRKRTTDFKILNKISTLNRTMVLQSLIKHETLTITDIGKKENLGISPDKMHLNFLLNELLESRDIDTLNGVIPCTYTITTKGIKEGERLGEVS